MTYIFPPPPADDEVIFVSGDGTPWTWGEHREMEATLRELEKTDPSVAEARARLDRTLEEHGVQVNTGRVVLQCEYCGKPEFVTHEVSCPDYLKDLPVTREAGAYQYLTDKFEIVHSTSVHCNDEEALDYFRIVQLMFPREGPDFRVKYIMRREMHEGDFHMLPWQYDADTKEVLPIERS